MRRAVQVAFVSALLLLAAPEFGRAALEASPADPRSLALGGSNPAWPIDGAPPLDGSGVIGAASRAGSAFAINRREAIPDLADQAAVGWLRAGAWRLALALATRSIAGYSESEAMLTVTRPSVAESSWGWSIAAGRSAWQIAADESVPLDPASLGASGWVGAFSVGGRVGSAVSLAARWLTRGGSLADEAPGRAEVGAALTLDAWRIGLAAESGAAGESWRLRVGAEWRAGSAFALRGGFRPDDGQSSVGLGAGVGPLRVDVARRDHPRLGTTISFGITLRTGGGA